LPQIPSQVKNQPFGTQNNAGLARKAPRPVQLIPGPAQGIEPLNSVGLPPDQARALQAVQKNITAATQQTRSDPTANKNFLQGVPLTNGGTNGTQPNIVAHGLGFAYSGYNIHAVYGGYITAHTLIPNSNPTLDSAQIQIWTLVTAFPNQTVMADIEIY
jgi:hypothetical protein